jgi:hypothetical protein
MLFLRYYLWITPHILLGVVLIASLPRRLHRQLPIFVAFVIFEILQFLVLFTASRFVRPSSIGVYLWFLTAGAMINGLLRLGVVYELTQSLILSRTALEEALRPVFTWTLAAMVVIAAVTSGSLRDVGRERLLNGFQILDFSSNLIFAGMLVVLFFFSRVLQVSWRGRATGVALGFGISACINLASAALRSGLGKTAFIAVDLTQMAAFHVSVVVWLIYLWLPDRTPALVGSGLGKSDIQFWDQELQRMTRQ